jgi:uncharacterized protein (DUF1330 family)
VQKKIGEERSKRLRSGQGHMSKKDLKQLKKKFNAEAAAKFGGAQTTDNAAPTERMRLSGEVISGGMMQNVATPQRLEMQRKAREDAKRFLDSQGGNVAQQLQFGAQGGEQDDAWWKAEEARWKAELEARNKAEGGGANDTSSTSSPEDICLRSQVVSKTPQDAGLGIQLFTPPDEQGVRITKIDPNGPFGRTGTFEDGDVIVEIDGTPLLYGGHTAVLAAISNAMQSHSEMVVTVCSPAELAKLEALVDDGEDVDDASPSTNTKQASLVIPPWLKTSTLVTMRALAQVGRAMVPNSLLGPRRNSDGTVGKVKGAPAWWKDGEKSPLVTATAGQGKAAVAPAAGTAAPAAKVRESYPEPAYLIYRAEIRDLEAYRSEYMDKTTELIQKFGGRWLARGGKVEALEGGGGGDGATVLHRMVLIEFPSMDAAKDFFRSAEYQEARQSRLSIATAELTVLEGMRPEDMPGQLPTMC